MWYFANASAEFVANLALELRTEVYAKGEAILLEGKLCAHLADRRGVGAGQPSGLEMDALL